VFEHARRLGAEGIVSKRRDRPHRAGRSTEWPKSKCTLRQEFVVGGFTDPEGARSGVGALLLGYYEERLVFAGRVGTSKGWTGAFLEELRAGLNKIEQDDCPFEPKPRREIVRAAHWVQPALVAEVEFVEWTSHGSTRHPTFCGFRADLRARDVRRESSAELDTNE
jgi:bifunctional non-homologous end joining protein LigD